MMVNDCILKCSIFANLYLENTFKIDGDSAEIVVFTKFGDGIYTKHVLREYIASKRDVIFVGKASFIRFQRTTYQVKPMTFDKVVLYTSMSY